MKLLFILNSITFPRLGNSGRGIWLRQKSLRGTQCFQNYWSSPEKVDQGEWEIQCGCNKGPANSSGREHWSWENLSEKSQNEAKGWGRPSLCVLAFDEDWWGEEFKIPSARGSSWAGAHCEPISRQLPRAAGGERMRCLIPWGGLYGTNTLQRVYHNIHCTMLEQ